MLEIINFFFKSSWRVIVITSITSGITAVLNLLVIRYLIEMVTDADNVSAESIGLIILMTLVSAIISIYMGKYITKYYSLKVTDYRKMLSEEVIKGEFQNNEMKLGNFVSVLLYEVNTIGNFGRSISGVLSAFFQLLVVIIYLFTMSWQLTLLIIFVFAIMNVLNFKVLPMMRAMENDISQKRYALYCSLVRFVNGLKDLSVHSRHAKKYVDNSVYLPSYKLAFRELDLHVLKSKMESFRQVIAMIGITAAIVIFISYFEMEQEMLFKYLTLVLFIAPSAATLFSFLKDIEGIQNAMDQVQEFDVNIMKGGDTTSHDIEMKSDESPLISLRDVEFLYGAKSGFKLGPISFDIMKNEIVIINGNNGSGKSTLFRIIVGLFWPDKGKVYFQGREITKEILQSYRDYFGCYFTDSPVFDDLTYLDQSRISQHADELIHELQLNGKITFDKIGHVTTPGLSHGQHGRLNLLRLLLQDNDIYFFDEWAANQDFHFKEYFYRDIVPSLKSQGKTVIIISHDDKFYDIADRVISLKNGQLIDSYL